MFEIRNKARVLLDARRQHPGWKLLAARRAPLVLSCLQTLFSESDDGIEKEATLQSLSELLAEFANDDTVGSQRDPAQEARKELNDWLRARLVIEREGRLYATDALEKAMDFVGGLDQRLMTSTASRLSVVQREIENLDVHLNPDAKLRGEHIRHKIADLQAELARVEAGDVQVLEPDRAMEAIREVYNLAMGLRADFRRVEDSYRAADQALREAIISSQSHRGEILDELLNGAASLLKTPEGQVFYGFFEQLQSEASIQVARARIKSIIGHPYCKQALEHSQRQDLRWLFIRLNREAETVLRARERSENDVRGFLKSGLIEEHHRVGDLLEALQKAALDLDWESHALRKTQSALPPVNIDTRNLPLIERLRTKSLESGPEQSLELSRKNTNLNDVEDDFWLSFDSLDQQALLEDTRQLLKDKGTAMSLGQLADQLPPSHDLETLAFWLDLAREAGVSMADDRETIDLADSDEAGVSWRFNVPRLALTSDAIEAIDWDAKA